VDVGADERLLVPDRRSHDRSEMNDPANASHGRVERTRVGEIAGRSLNAWR